MIPSSAINASKIEGIYASFPGNGVSLAGPLDPFGFAVIGFDGFGFCGVAAVGVPWLDEVEPESALHPLKEPGQTIPTRPELQPRTWLQPYAASE